ncbi:MULTISPECIES: DeoR/GlpR family DNA-binding transcription regulator [Streptomyces]|uniref:DeoR/GlpR family DNA-binding transcription regulator n=1 Tax=Streptomyces TaxID=1883 RepID=UPI001CCDA87F|nr:MULTISPECIES: DeoR/GlpR family DNA-binding transcription regulator [Streptomyces]MBZ6134941.1 DeoR/GlpR family DNA-binding transcription regulator [Streptomyces olivaceus]MBZ6252625.1 DeoR/GlpR family DNA-binding transcription regulator [Streptomyces olivaceus]MCU8595566.1 DeoR/GlpR family DNA-binding transcription regulator [Streptomyces sp. A13(2022)]
MSGAADRRERIVTLARDTGLTGVGELSARFAVSPSTIRRDLARLTADGRLARTYGGAMALRSGDETPLHRRTAEAADAKRAVAALAATHVAPGATVFLDAGSTAAALARVLRGTGGGPAVVTPSLSAVLELGGADGVRVTCLGGDYRPLSHAFVGPLTEAALDRMTFDAAFLGTDGVSPELGICEAGAEQIRLKERAARRSRRVFVLAHAAKLGAAPFHHWAPWQPGWTLVTDAAPDHGPVRALRAREVEVLSTHE